MPGRAFGTTVPGRHSRARAVAGRFTYGDPFLIPQVSVGQAQLLDERSRPDFRDLYASRAAVCDTLDAAVGRIRLGGMNLGDRELSGLSRVRLVVAELSALTLSSEAETMAVDPVRRPRLELLLSLFAAGRLHVRIAPLAGWNPDFSVFHPGPGPRGALGGADVGGAAVEGAVLLGPHLFDRPYPHPGPAFGILVTGPAVALAASRFEALWAGAHDLERPIVNALSDALEKGAPGPRRRA